MFFRVASAWLVCATMVLSCGDDTESVSTDECASGTKWVGGNEESALMNPGQACIACHRSDEGPDFSFAGTLYGVLNQPDNCFGLEGYTVEITDANGTVHKAATNEAGNFFKEGRAIATPYTAVVRAPNGTATAMVTPQSITDCNTCHSQTGAQGAAGRIFVTQ